MSGRGAELFRRHPTALGPPCSPLPPPTHDRTPGYRPALKRVTVRPDDHADIVFLDIVFAGPPVANALPPPRPIPGGSAHPAELLLQQPCTAALVAQQLDRIELVQHQQPDIVPPFILPVRVRRRGRRLSGPDPRTRLPPVLRLAVRPATFFVHVVSLRRVQLVLEPLSSAESVADVAVPVGRSPS